MSRQWLRKRLEKNCCSWGWWADCRFCSEFLWICRGVWLFWNFSTRLFDVIWPAQCIFAGLQTLWLCFDLSLILILIADGNCQLNSFWKKEAMIQNIALIYLMEANYGTKSHPFCSNLWLIDFLIEMRRIFAMRWIRTKRYFVLKETNSCTSQTCWYSSNDNEAEKERIACEMNEIRQVLKLNGTSRLESCSNAFQGWIRRILLKLMSLLKFFELK
jgi:hypothetical protein